MPSPGDAISFAALLATIITGILLPLIQHPSIIYAIVGVQDSGAGSKTYDILILNYGLTSAKNVFVSLKAPSTMVVLDLQSLPFLSTTYYLDNSKFAEGIAFGKIDILPPFGSVHLSANISPGASGATITEPQLYVSSDEVIGGNPLWTGVMISVHIIVILILYWGLRYLWRKYLTPARRQANSR